MFCKNKSKNNIDEEVVIEVKEIPKKIKIPLTNNKYEVLGNVVLKEVSKSVTLTAIISGIKPGTHKIHIIKTKTNSFYLDENAHKSWNPKKKDSYKGYVGDFIADENGDGTISKISDNWCMGCSNENKNILGKTVVVFSEKELTNFPDIKDISCFGKIE